VAISQANRINRACGGVVVAPWEIDQLDDDWLEAFDGLAERLPAMQKGAKRAEQAAEEWRAKFRK
jgi:hypothetical protein